MGAGAGGVPGQRRGGRERGVWEGGDAGPVGGEKRLRALRVSGVSGRVCGRGLCGEREGGATGADPGGRRSSRPRGRARGRG